MKKWEQLTLMECDKMGTTEKKRGVTKWEPMTRMGCDKMGINEKNGA